MEGELQGPVRSSGGERIRPTSSVELGALLDAGIERALERGTGIDAMTARIIALVLAPDPDSASARFALSGESEQAPRNDELRVEYLPTYLDPTTPAAVKELIDWLGTYLVDRDNGDMAPRFQPPGVPKLGNSLWRTQIKVEGRPFQLRVRADLPAHALEGLSDALAPLLKRYGEPFEAFLTLRDVEASSPQLEEAFLDCYRGTYVDRYDLIREVTDLTEIEQAVDHINQTFLGGEFVRLDGELLSQTVAHQFDIVEQGGALHVFDR
jgi:hypothetical protein